MLTPQQKLEISQRVVTSDSFKNAPTGVAMLKYLVEAHLEERPLKEGTIDLEFFGAEPNGDNRSPRVRVTIYNLRKKLVKYYEEEGKNADWRIHIDKGQYGLRFERQHQAEVPSWTPRIKLALPYGLLAVTLTALIFSHLPKPAPTLWSGFFNHGHPTYLYIGNAFGYGGRTVSGRPGWTRDFRINTLDQYYHMLEEQPELKTTTHPSDFFYATRMAEHATHDLTRLFTQWDQQFQIKYATQTSFDDIKKSNTIYVGRWLHQQDFLYLFNASSPYVKLKGAQITCTGSPYAPDTTLLTDEEGTDVDYAVVSRTQGPNDTDRWFFCSNHDIGVMATVAYFTDPDSLAAFANLHLPETPYFTAVYKAKGKERTDLELEQVWLTIH